MNPVLRERLREALALESRWLTVAFWGAVAVHVAAFWVTPFPPCIDYPQHLLIATYLQRWLAGAAPERALLEPALITYNGAFQLGSALLGFVVPMEVAGKLMLSLVAPITGVGTLGLLRAAQRPRWPAFFVLPFCFGHTMGWGFVNWTLGAPLAVLLLSWWLRYADGERRLGARIALVGVALAYTHVLATLSLCVAVTVCHLASAATPRALGFAEWFKESVRRAWPLLPAAAWSVFVYRVHISAPNIFWVPEHDGRDVYAYQKLLSFTGYAVENFADGTDIRLFQLGLVALLVLFVSPWWLAPSGPAPRRELVALTAFWLLAYLAVPQQLMSTAFIFERFPYLVVVTAVAILPAVPPSLSGLVAPIAVAVGLGSALNTVRHLEAIPETADASAIVDAVPEGARLVPALFEHDARPVLTRPMWVHLPAYAAIRRRADLAFDFLRYASMVMRRKQALDPTLYPGGLEWNASWYRTNTAYARRYPIVLARAPQDAPTSSPAGRLFGADAARVRVLAQRGRYWLFDVSPIFSEPSALPGDTNE